MRNSQVIALWLMMGCQNKTTGSSGPIGAEKPPLWPFPSAHLMSDGHISLPAEEVPVAVDGNLISLDRLQYRDGFSLVQSSVIDFGTSVDGTSLPGPSEAISDGAIQLWDLTAGVPIRCFAEVDAYPELDGEAPIVIVRPLDLLPDGHRIAVVVTDQVLTTDGDIVPAPQWYTDVLAGRPGPGLNEWVDHYDELNEDLVALGLENVVFAFDFPVSNGGDTVRAVAEQVRTPSAWTIEDIRDVDLGYSMPTGAWRQIIGTFTTDSFLLDEEHLRIEDGLPIAEGNIEAKLFIHMPDSIRDAEPGTVPVWLFGHGIFGSPEEYLKSNDDRSTLVEMADEAGVIVVASSWYGLRAEDRLHALYIARDFGRMAEIIDRLHQGIANTLALSALTLHGDLLQIPELEGKADPSQLMYYGISLGGIAGAVMLANNEDIEHGVLHVGGSAWSTMLERSSQWLPFDWGMSDSVPSARDRQLLYAMSQLYWDPVDPANHVAGLMGRSLLWQEAIGDEQVANITTELIGRAVDAQMLMPSVTEVADMPTAVGPTVGPAIAQFDPELPMPPEENRPSPMTQAHSTPRTWPGARQQVTRFLDVNDPGVVEHFCGEAPCAESNQGIDVE